MRKTPLGFQVSVKGGIETAVRPQEHNIGEALLHRDTRQLLCRFLKNPVGWAFLY